MSKYNNIEAVRNMLLNGLERVDNGKMPLEELMVRAKSCEGIFSSVKLQLSYAHMKGESPYIPFLDEVHLGESKVKKIAKK